MPFDISRINDIDEEEVLPEWMDFPDIDEYPPKKTFPIGTKFWQITDGGRKLISKIWEVDSYIGNDNYLCKPISDNTVGELNKDYKESFSESQINKILTETPIVKI
jgi:hypothetical protein